MTKGQGLEIIKEKVNKFQTNEKLFKKKGYGETNIRTNFIDPFFEALGWNMKSHLDVIREYSQRDKSTTFFLKNK